MLLRPMGERGIGLARVQWFVSCDDVMGTERTQLWRRLEHFHLDNFHFIFKTLRSAVVTFCLHFFCPVHTRFTGGGQVGQRLFAARDTSASDCEPMVPVRD